jgi:hypothetical protein
MSTTTDQPYDSRPDTLAHIARVQELMAQSCANLQHRAEIHDQSKLEEPERSGFDRCTVKLKTIPYGSEEYKAALAELKPVLDHHYANNRHHPEKEEFGSEEWRSITDVPGYEVSSLGRVRSIDRIVHREGGKGDLLKRGLILRENLTPKGYKRVQLSVNSVPINRLVHVLVAEAFHGSRPHAGMQVNHKDGDKQNNREKNLEWVTPTENIQHSYDLGLRENQLKYFVVCTLPDGREISTRGVTKMEELLRTLGYTEARDSGILAAISNGGTHLGLQFEGFPIAEPRGYSGIDNMSLFDLIEMLLDWKAATERMKNGGNIRRSLEINTDRFKISPQLHSILANTIEEMGW